MQFLGRERELKLARAELDSQRPSLIIVFGRQRIGKSRFLRKAAKKRPEIYFQATRVSSLLNLEQFKSDVGKAIGTKPQLEALSSWEGVLHYVAERAGEHPGLIVTTNFPICLITNQHCHRSCRNSGIPALANGAMKPILCGPAISQMEDLLAERNPLYGRKTLSLDMKVLPRRRRQVFPGVHGRRHYQNLCNFRRHSLLSSALRRSGTAPQQRHQTQANSLLPDIRS